jgi:hypothetical protein
VSTADGKSPVRPSFAWVAGMVALGVSSVLVPPLAVPAVVVILILGLSFPTDVSPPSRTAFRVATWFAVIGALAGLGRFAASKAMLGIVEGGESATAYSALWRLREVVIAEDAARRTAPWDPDQDHVGSALFIGALAGTAPLPDGKALPQPFLNYAFNTLIETSRGPAAKIEAYLVLVCLPTPDGGFTARPTDAVDAELAERRYVAYAWPSDEALGMKTSFFADEHERLLVLDPPPNSPSPYRGVANPPPCDAALGTGASAWTPWKKKQPRKTLPGDPSVSER